MINSNNWLTAKFWLNKIDKNKIDKNKINKNKIDKNKNWYIFIKCFKLFVLILLLDIKLF